MPLTKLTSRLIVAYAGWDEIETGSGRVLVMLELFSSPLMPATFGKSPGLTNTVVFCTSQVIKTMRGS